MANENSGNNMNADRPNGENKANQKSRRPRGGKSHAMQRGGKSNGRGNFNNSTSRSFTSGTGRESNSESRGGKRYRGGKNYYNNYRSRPNTSRFDKEKTAQAFERDGDISSTVKDLPQENDNIDETGNVCLICDEEIKVYAIAKCDHKLCMNCSIKMRVLAEDYTCPMCRIKLDKVIISDKLLPFSDLTNDNLFREYKFKEATYFFTSKELKNRFYEVQAPKCPICIDRSPDKTMEQTRTHMRQQHELFYCDLCLEHDKQFFCEYSYYDRKNLALHKRKGDGKNTSHYGHPICHFCDQHFYDKDHLYKHLRKDHYFCHICDRLADQSSGNEGNKNAYYRDYEMLREHFIESHYLCEEDECKNDKFTNVFASKMDLQAHNLQNHKGKMSKVNIKEQQRVEIEYNYPEPSSSQNNYQGHRRRNRNKRFSNATSAFERDPTDADLQQALKESKLLAERQQQNDGPPTPPPPEMNNQELFPLLEATEKATTSAAPLIAPGWKQGPSSSTNLNSTKDFPSLGGSSTSKLRPPFGPKKLVPKSKPTVNGTKPTISQQLKKVKQTSHNKSKKQNFTSNESSFPSLSSSTHASNPLHRAGWNKIPKNNKSSTNRSNKSGNSTSYPILTSENKFCVLKHTTSNSNSTQSTNKKKKTKQMPFEEENEPVSSAGFTSLSRNLMSQDSVNTQTTSNIGMISEKPNKPSSVPAKNAPFKNSATDFPTLSSQKSDILLPGPKSLKPKKAKKIVARTILPPPGFTQLPNKFTNIRSMNTPNNFVQPSGGPPPGFGPSKPCAPPPGFNANSGVGKKKGQLNLGNMFD